MAGLVDLAAQRAPLFGRHATGTPASILRWLGLQRWLLRCLPLRWRRLPLLLRRLPSLLPIAPSLGTALAALVAALLALFAPLLTTATTPLAIALTGKRTGTDNCQQQGHACSIDQVVKHFFFRNAAATLPE